MLYDLAGGGRWMQVGVGGYAEGLRSSATLYPCILLSELLI